MDDAEQRVREGHAREALRVVHPVARRHIAVVRLDKVLADHLDRVQRERVGVVAVQRRDISLDRVGHRVHAGVRRQLLRHRLGKFGVYYRHVGRDVEIRQRVLDALRVVGDDGEGRNLRRRSRRRGDGAELRLLAQRREIEGDAEGLKGRVGVFIEGPHRLRRVDRRTAADGDDPVGLELAHHSRAPHDRLD
ncbi:hypothetical protein SDC9_149708 [bioreactor metagenome]|uniref:Uncharacterized protein n=1 Tax=bioreactor metagenome TaxID=1076179 RepID=A0A645EMJ0_9ZZZZ